MIIHVANPIYDSVFKYIMEDERIAKTILSALLKKEVVHVTVRPHEYCNTTRDTLSMFRIDFAATVREKEGNEIKDRIVLIELQKTWLNTETLRFRQYLGAQYNNKNNIREADEKGYAYPMVAVYLLGHRVGNINTPVVYVNHHTYDYDGNLLESDEPNPFVESLTHNSIIVQIPLLHGHINNRLDKILSVFDQTNASKSNKQTIEVNEDEYAGDSEMEYIVRRLLSAASNPDVRQDMNVEDEYFKAIEDRDTELMVREKAIKARDEAIQELDEAIKEREEAIKEKDKLLTNAIEGMLSKNMDLQTIASILGMSESDLSDYLHQ